MTIGSKQGIKPVTMTISSKRGINLVAMTNVSAILEKKFTKQGV